MERVGAGRKQIEAIVATYEAEYAAFQAGDKACAPVQDYGVTTGFGEFKDIPVPPDQLVALQHNLLRSHAAGVGAGAAADDPAGCFPAEVVRAVLVIRLNTFLRARSGVRPALLEMILRMLHAGIVPLVPLRGSLGSSGDLCPLAHLFGILLGQGRYYLVRQRQELDALPRAVRPASELMEDLGREPLLPTYKEGLALSNGATFSTAMLALAVHDAACCATAADVAGALSLEAVCGCARAFDPKIHAERGHQGQIASAANLRRLVAESQLLDAACAVQDPYSLRCMPVVHGTARDAIGYARMVVEREMNAATDNPLFFPDHDGPDSPAEEQPWDWRFAGNWPPGYNGKRRRSYSAGNFHGQPIALAADLLTMAVAELASIGERRTQLLLDQHHNRNLPANLVARRGVQSGYMLAQYSAASLVTENRTLSHPASVDSVPTAANIEDHVANATVAARKARDVVANVQAAQAIELLVASQAVEWRIGMALPPRRPEWDHVRPVRAEEGWQAAEKEAVAFAAAVADNKSIAARLGLGTRAAYLAVRQAVPTLLEDRELAGEIGRIGALLHRGELLARVEAALGEGLRSVSALGTGDDRSFAAHDV